MTPRPLSLLDPESGHPLVHDRPWSLTGGQKRWPVVATIPFLRVGRESLRAEALAAMDEGDQRRALLALLGDQDDYARIAPPDPASLGELIDAVAAGGATLRDAMHALHFGPVADYFAFRWSSPTYLSGLALLDRFAGAAGAGPVVEVACGVGPYLRELALRERACVGIDVVFSKLWLARRFVVPADVSLVCGDVAAGFPLAPIAGGAVAFCHDAFYFLPGKPAVVAGMQRVVGPEGRILIGHAHNRDFDHGSVAGEPRSPAEYADLLPGCMLFDDAELTRSVWTGAGAVERSAPELADVESVAMVWTASGDPRELVAESGPPALLDPIPGRVLRLNPLMIGTGGSLAPGWPSERFRAEYEAASGYLLGERVPDPETVAAASGGEVGRGLNPEVDRLARRRIFLDLPGRW